MSDSVLRFALREIQSVYARPRSLAGMAVIAAILGLAGPFGTFGAMSIGARLAYWGAVVFVTYGVGVFAAQILLRLVPRDFPLTVRVGLVGFGAGVPVTLSVMAIGALFSGAGGASIGPWRLWGYCTLIALGVTTISFVMESSDTDTPADKESPQSAAAAAPEAVKPAILDRLPADKRGPLIEMTVQDHYVAVTTTRGTALVLMRLTDAIAETRGVDGLQIHRSHWVALEGVASVERRQGKAIVTTTAGSALPVSRTYLTDVRAAGLLV